MTIEITFCFKTFQRTGYNRESERSQSTTQQNTPTSPFFGQINANRMSPMSNFDPRFVWPSANVFGGVNDVNANHQFAMMQQAYAQYISQYMQM